MQVGSIIKSFDFPGNTECYMIGEVVGFECDDEVIVAKAIKAVFKGKTKSIDQVDVFRTPKQGLGMLDDIFERVVLVG